MVEGTSCSGPGWMGIAMDLERSGWRDKLFRVSLDGRWLWKGVVGPRCSGCVRMGIAMDLERGG